VRPSEYSSSWPRAQPTAWPLHIAFVPRQECLSSGLTGGRDNNNQLQSCRKRTNSNISKESVMNFNNWALGKLDLTSDRGLTVFCIILRFPAPGSSLVYNPGIVELIVVLAIPGTVAAFCTAVLVQQDHRQARWPANRPAATRGKRKYPMWERPRSTAGSMSGRFLTRARCSFIRAQMRQM
jgi:hypothetical protein